MSKKKKVIVINFPSDLFGPTISFPSSPEFPSDLFRPTRFPPPPPPDVFPNYPPPSSTSATPMPPPSMPKTNSSRRWLPFVFLASGAYIFMSSRRHSTESRKANLEDSYIPVQSGDTTTSSEEY